MASDSCMNDQSKTRKEVSYCYPTSPNARQFKLANGGYVVSLSQPGKSPRAVAGYASKAQAIGHAEAIGVEWSPFTVR
jgi:hypothetical protein